MSSELIINVTCRSNGGFAVTASVPQQSYSSATQCDNSAFTTAKEVGEYVAELCENLDVPETTLKPKVVE